MVCTTCSHAQVDHATGRCVHRRMYHDPAVGAVTESCTCKRFAAPVAEPVVEAVVVEETKPEEEAAAETQAEEEPKQSRFRPRRRGDRDA